MTAVYDCQHRNLNLRPWEFAPEAADLQSPMVDPNDERLIKARALRDRLVAFGLSQFEPHPLAALEAAQHSAYPAS
jgi:hypothetical protein